MHFAEWKCCRYIPIQISLKFVPKCPINHKLSLVQIMAWRRTGDKSLSELMIAFFTNASLSLNDLREDILSISCAIAFRWMPQNTLNAKSTLVQLNGLVPSGSKPLAKLMLTKFYDAIWFKRSQWVTDNYNVAISAHWVLACFGAITQQMLPWQP